MSSQFPQAHRLLKLTRQHPKSALLWSGAAQFPPSLRNPEPLHVAFSVSLVGAGQHHHFLACSLN